MITLRLEALDLRAGARVLDLGCGRGRHAHALYWGGPSLTVAALDLSEEDLGAAFDGVFDLPPPPDRENRALVFSVGDAARLPFADGAFDGVICSEVLEHLPDVDAALAEIARILKPGGTFALSVPRYWPEAICWRLSEGYRNTPGGHVRIFRTRALRRQVRGFGFSAYKRHHAHALHSPYWWLQCALWRKRETSGLIKAYRRFLEWDLMKAPRLTRWLETALNPILGKSVALYFRKAAGP